MWGSYSWQRGSKGRLEHVSPSKGTRAGAMKYNLLELRRNPCEMVNQHRVDGMQRAELTRTLGADGLPSRAAGVRDSRSRVTRGAGDARPHNPCVSGEQREVVRHAGL